MAIKNLRVVSLVFFLVNIVFCSSWRIHFFRRSILSERKYLEWLCLVRSRSREYFQDLGMS